MTWTAVVENTTTHEITTPIFQGSWSGKQALSLAEELFVSPDERIVCLVKGSQAQGIYPSLDNDDYTFELRRVSEGHSDR